MVKVSFQYPQSDRYPCNPEETKVSDAETDFQYPRSDRYPCNNYELRWCASSAGAFQYPQSDRYPCNNAPAKETCHKSYLSVSSVGSIPLQPYVLARRLHAGQLSVSSVGSIPLQLMRQCKMGWDIRIFQYPQSDRYPCNQICIWLAVLLFWTFSILSRIDTPATPRGSGLWPADQPLSVSSVGSIPLQLQTLYSPGRKNFVLSVSSVGSIPLQPTL